MVYITTKFITKNSVFSIVRIIRCYIMIQRQNNSFQPSAKSRPRKCHSENTHQSVLFRFCIYFHTAEKINSYNNQYFAQVISVHCLVFYSVIFNANLIVELQNLHNNFVRVKLFPAADNSKAIKHSGNPL